MKQIQEDYYKVNETQTQGQGQGQGQGQPTAKVLPSTILPPTPLHGELGAVPTSILRAMEELSQAPLGDGQSVKKEDAQNTKDRETAPMSV